MRDHPFQDVLLRFSQEADEAQRQRIEQDIWRDYGSRQVVLVVDMSGFSSLTSRYGIVHYLSMVRRMQLTAEPIIRSFGGVLLKFEADNAFAIFPEVEGALRAATALNLAFDAANRLTPEALDIHIACGIDVGEILVVEQRDFFGDAVNRACKLGEDLAEPGEILITADAMTELGQPPSDEGQCWQMESRTYRISGLSLQALSLRLLS
ncbi:adenylate/guanylate cyclase domain-containing protein [Pseudomarimonas arenosa]|uniref:Adenylate/guanylate cyclase domain-containing protein n=1 Tax=Pseudomarimonas arenosa TaxID=2774145 RepID=A0AAW3ZUT2_9GAMM|nr:adenylate/guanylate cyclase domain-containing protein [Pseudomarimonas arenosa]MBD8527801.1 adenylate/guanylate cyclase domain-containing protein [Pseudomarimonas arenosa]